MSQLQQQYVQTVYSITASDANNQKNEEKASYNKHKSDQAENPSK